MIGKTPDQLGLGFSLWTRQAIQNLVLKLWSIYMPLRTISDYMKRLGFTLQKPIKCAYEQNLKAVRKWIDETGLSSHTNYFRGFSPKGKTPMLYMEAKYLNLNVISSISTLGKMRFMTYKETLSTKIFIKFTGRLCTDVELKVFIILDNLAVHHSKIFMKWLEKRRDKISG